jgi:imidazolonepropionase-like amidohydrolase
VRDCGSNQTRAPLALSKLAFDPALPLPRILSCGAFITMTGGHVHWEAVEADGAEEVRKAVRSEVKFGAQWIKLIATGGVLTPGTDVGAASYTRDELLAGTAEAANAGRPVAAHAIGAVGIKNALAAGVRTIEHGSFLDEEAVAMMIDRNAFHISTLCAYHQVVSNGIKAGVPEHSVRKAEYATEANQDSFRRSLERGVNIAAGSDAGTPFNRHGTVALEVKLMVEAGATTNQALRSATSGAATALGIEEETGSLEVGKCGDVLLVATDPLDDITALDEPVAVIRAGQLVVDARMPERSEAGVIELPAALG